MQQEITSQATFRKDGSWTQEEHEQFIDGLLAFGKDWNKITQCVPSRSGVQIRSHAQKFFNKLENQYESRTILGKQSLKIMGVPQNQKQYLVYIKIGKSIQFRQIQVLNLPFYDQSLAYSVEPRINKKKQRRQNEISQQKNSDTKSFDSQYFKLGTSPISETPNPCFDTEHRSTHSWFVQNIQQNRSILEISQNFYGKYVDVEFIGGKVLGESNQMKRRMNSYASTGRELDSYEWRDPITQVVRE